MNLPELRIGDKVAKYPVVQGGMSVRISLHKLVSAVANAGGVGTIGGMAIPPGELREEIQNAKELSNGVMGVNLMYAGYQFDRLLDVCIKEKVDFVAIGAGFAREPFKRLKEHGIPGMAIISSAKAARVAAKTEGVSGVIVESGQAGGHLGPKDPNISIWELFPEVKDTLDKVGFNGPVIAAGGILDRLDIDRALAMGADGVQMGTRFAVSEESAASPGMKQAWLKSIGSQVEDWSPTGMLSRAIVPHLSERLPKIGINGLRCENCLKACRHRDDPSLYHCIRKALTNAQEGNVEDGLIFAGNRVGEISELLSVKEIFNRLVGQPQAMEA